VSRIKFPSLSMSDKYVWLFTSEWDFRRTPMVCNSFQMYETLGDGTTSHTPDWPISQELLPDYLESLAVAMLGNPELIGAAQYTLGQGPSDDAIEFAASIKFKPSDEDYGKRRFFSKAEQKISSSASKEHDKRYERIVEWMNAEATAILGLCLPGHCDNWERYLYAEAVRKWCNTNDGHGYMQPAPEHLKWWHDRELSIRVEYALDCCHSAMAAVRQRAAAEGMADCIKRQVERRRLASAETAELAVAS